MFGWGIDNFVDDDMWQRFQINEVVLRHKWVVDALLCSQCEFKELPYIKEFIEFLVNYRIEHQLLQITEEQIDEVLNSYIVKRNEHQKQKVLQPNQTQE